MMPTMLRACALTRHRVSTPASPVPCRLRRRFSLLLPATAPKTARVSLTIRLVEGYCAAVLIHWAEPRPATLEILNADSPCFVFEANPVGFEFVHGTGAVLSVLVFLSDYGGKNAEAADHRVHFVRLTSR